MEFSGFVFDVFSHWLAALAGYVLGSLVGDRYSYMSGWNNGYEAGKKLKKE